jgi:hypothetical protein
MPTFQKYFEHHFDALPTTTVYRFAELEIAQAQGNLFAHMNPVPMLINILGPENPRILEEAMRSPHFRQTSKPEIILYMMYHHIPYKKIREVTGLSPNTISKYKYQGPDIYYPVFQEWTPEMLHRWRAFRQTQNLWLEKLIHDTSNEANPDYYESDPFYVPTRNPFGFSNNE